MVVYLKFLHKFYQDFVEKNNSLVLAEFAPDIFFYIIKGKAFVQHITLSYANKIKPNMFYLMVDHQNKTFLNFVDKVTV